MALWNAPNLESALKKSEIHQHGKKSKGQKLVLVAYLTPTEICALAKTGLIEANETTLKRAETKKKRGESSSTWFYYTPRGKLVNYFVYYKR